LLLELLNRRYEERNSIIITNKPFAQWQEFFPSADASYRLSLGSCSVPKSSRSRASHTASKKPSRVRIVTSADAVHPMRHNKSRPMMTGRPAPPGRAGLLRVFADDDIGFFSQMTLPNMRRFTRGNSCATFKLKHGPGVQNSSYQTTVTHRNSDFPPLTPLAGRT
jgi:hypothetical protein